MKVPCIDWLWNGEAVKPGQQLPVLGRRSGKWGEVPQTSLDLVSLNHPNQTQTLWEFPSHQWKESLEFMVLTPTIVQRCLLWWLHIESAFIGCYRGSAEGDGKLEVSSAFSELLDLRSPWIRHKERNLVPWVSAGTQLTGCVCWNIRVSRLGNTQIGLYLEVRFLLRWNSFLMF